MARTGARRWAVVHGRVSDVCRFADILHAAGGLATPGYVAVTVVFTILFVRAGLPLDGFGFGRRLDLRQIMLAVAAFTALRVFALVLNPLVEETVGGPRNLERFSGVEGSVASLIALLAVNWTLAAFGEEFAYRIVLMRGISFVLGDSGEARICAVAAQALPSSRILESLCRRHQSINFPSL